MSQRTEKVASVIKRAIAIEINNIAREFSAGMATVTEVKISPDLQNAKVFISTFAGKINTSEFVIILDNMKTRVKSAIMSNTELRFVPDLKFYFDESLDKIDNIQKLLDKSKAEQITSLENFDESEYQSKKNYDEE
jgi:ribosome-binding factor A